MLSVNRGSMSEPDLSQDASCLSRLQMTWTNFLVPFRRVCVSLAWNLWFAGWMTPSVYPHLPSPSQCPNSTEEFWEHSPCCEHDSIGLLSERGHFHFPILKPTSTTNSITNANLTRSWNRYSRQQQPKCATSSKSHSAVHALRSVVSHASQTAHLHVSSPKFREMEILQMSIARSARRRHLGS